MTNSDRFTKAVNLTTDLDLPQDTALPAQRQQHVSSILKSMVASPSEGEMERAAMATVFGVREYTQAKAFWESHDTSFYATGNSKNDQCNGTSSVLTPKSASEITFTASNSTRVHSLANNISAQQHRLPPSAASQNQHYASPYSQHGTPSSLVSMKESGQPQSPIPGSSSNDNTNSSASNRPVDFTFTLPDIPTVSKFDDWLTTSSQILSSKARVVTPSNVKYYSSSANPIQPFQQQYQHVDTEVVPPLVFFSYPPVIFDLLKSNTDDRIIIWEPDPQCVSMSGAITTNYSLASLQPAAARLGFSSNTTTAIPAPASSLRSTGSTPNSLKSTASWINKVKQSIQHPASSSSTSVIDNKGENASMLMDQRQRKRTLQHRLNLRFFSKKDQHQQSYPSTLSDPATPPLVIQAATVEKLVEILTLTLDYTFMTDFFLTYRTFILPIQLCKLLILRFQWALENDEDERRVVRIRTFVVLRHWLLNYFIHDFTSSRQLRQTLTLFLNTLPSHSLVKHSRLDQRIVKSLKRVVRRLKKVHYPGSSSQRVQVISPPPPIWDQDQVRGMVYEKLEQGPLRRKAHEWFHKDLTLVENWHHGNMIFQDARTADIVVVGSLDKSPLTPAIPSPPIVSSTTNRHGSINNNNNNNNNASSGIHHQQQPLPSRFNLVSKRQRNTSQNSIVTYAVSALSRKRLRQQELRKVKESYLQRMEQQKRMTLMNNNNNNNPHHCSQQNSPGGLDNDFKKLNIQQDHTSDVTSDISSDSILSPGTTDDELETDGDDDADSASANGSLEVMDDCAAQQNESYQAVPSVDDMTRRNQHYLRAHNISAVENYPHRRSVYNAVLSNLSPLVSPNGSVIHGPLAHNSDSGKRPSTLNGYSVMKSPQERRLATPSSSMDNVLPLPMELNINGLGHEKVDEYRGTDEILVAPPSATFNQYTHQVKNRVSKSLLENDEQHNHILVGNGKMDTHDEKALIESPTSMSLDSNGSLSLKLQHGSESIITTTSKKSQRKLSRRLSNALRFGGNIRPTKATVVQPEMMMASTIASSIYQNSVVAQLNHRHQQHFNKPDTPPHHYQQQHQGHGYRSNINTERVSNQSSVMDLQTLQQHQHPDINYLVNIRASLDEDTYQPPYHIDTEERNHPHHPLLRAPELGAIPQPSTDSIPPSLSALFKPALILQHRTHALAQQFCLIEKWILLQINWEELVHCRWTKMGDFVSSTDVGSIPKRDHGFTTSSSRQQRQGDGGVDDNEQEGGVQQLIERFNIVCRWVSSEIVRTPSLDERVMVIEKFIRLAQKCHMYSNFATLIQILLGLQSPSVSRLEKTWSKVNDSKMRLLKKLSSFTSPMKNWKHIRDSMTAVAEEYGMSPREIQVQLPDSNDRHQLHQTKIKLPFGGCIPFLGLYLSDLVFNSEQPSYLEPNHDHYKIYQSYTQSSDALAPALLRQPLINFRKHRITATIVKRFLTFRDLASRYSFEPIDSLYSDCFYLDVLETDTLGQLSLIIEPLPPSTTSYTSY